jgi:hypothetical protein
VADSNCLTFPFVSLATGRYGSLLAKSPSLPIFTSNSESAGDLSKQWKRLPQRKLPMSYASPDAYPVPDRKDRVSFIQLEGGLREKRTVSPDTVMVGIGISLEMTA